MMRRDFLFGFFSVYGWDYYWGLTAAQIELRIIDAPFIAYKADSSAPKPGEKGFKRTAAQANAEYENWLQNIKKEKEKGIKVNLDTFLSHGKETKEQAKS